MAEPSTTSIAAGGAALKFGIVSGIGALLSAIVVMAMTLPASRKEWIAGLVSTVSGSVLGGSLLVQHFGLTDWINQGFFGLASVIGLIFAAGLPFWVLVRAFFRYAEKSKGKGLVEMIREIRESIKGKNDGA